MASYVNQTATLDSPATAVTSLDPTPSGTSSPAAGRALVGDIAGVVVVIIAIIVFVVAVVAN
ncbi:hypothetical protein V8F20_010310 [Naviculisporaceae sp. PSN 640]